MSKYDDIINLTHPEPKKRTRMSLYNRAAQFSPFSALTGHDDAIKETGRLTDRKIEPNEDAVEEINRKLLWIKDNIRIEPEVEVTYFIPDKNKSGGKYITATVNVIKIDEYYGYILTRDGLKIAIHNIFDIR